VGFSRKGNRHDVWDRFCEAFGAPLAESGMPVAVTRSEDRFRDLLAEGVAGEVSLAGLTDEQWHKLCDFVAVYFRECQSWGPLDLFPAMRRELERRGWDLLWWLRVPQEATETSSSHD
jgi:hypothetical protein